jgi:hypothetical protein
MNAAAFPGRMRNLTAVVMSLFAVLAVATYATAPVSASASISAAYVAARHLVVSGVVKSSSTADARTIRVTVGFRDSKARVIVELHLHADGHGRWQVRIPRGAVQVTVLIQEGGHGAKITKALHAGHSLKLTAVFPGRLSGLLPGLFPY